MARAELWASVASVCIAAALAGCSDDPETTNDGGGGGGPSDAVAFHRDIEPLLQQHCLSCHTEGRIGGFSLLTYEEASAQSGVIAANVESRLMPPFLAQNTDDCQVRFGFADDPRLTDDEIALFRAWDDAGAPEGDPKDAPPPYVISDPGLPNADIAIDAPVTTSVEGTEDIFKCVVYDPKLTADTWIDGIHFVPGNPKIDHHALLGRLDRADLPVGALEAGAYDCFGSPGDMIHGWVPGAVPLELPEGAAISLGANDVIVVQMHYHPIGAVETDRSTVELRKASGTPTYEFRTLLWGNARNAAQGLASGPDDSSSTPEFLIPAGVTDHTETMSLTLPGVLGIDLKILTVASHMHYVGVDERIQVTRAQPTADQPAEECLLETPHWDFNWQRGYLYDAAFESLPTVTGGDTITVQCTYDNDMGNPGVQKALSEQGLSMPIDIPLGESTLEEMCIAGFGVLVPVGTPGF
ncbi:MAG: hypothetical protein U0271_01840 [Polyangiaceae bacterium]